MAARVRTRARATTKRLTITWAGSTPVLDIDGEPTTGEVKCALLALFMAITRADYEAGGMPKVTETWRVLEENARQYLADLVMGDAIGGFEEEERSER